MYRIWEYKKILNNIIGINLHDEYIRKKKKKETKIIYKNV